MAEGEQNSLKQIPEHLLLSEELQVYKEGLTTYKSLLGVASDVDKLVLLNPHVLSMVIGIQPYANLSDEEMRVLVNIFDKAEIDITQKYSLFTDAKHFTQPSESQVRLLIQDVPDRPLLDEELKGYVSSFGGKIVNNKATELILRKYASQLNVDIPNNITNDSVENLFLQLYYNEFPYLMTLARGLLSGFPLEDSQEFASTYGKPMSGNLLLVKNPRTLFQSNTQPIGKFLNIEYYRRVYFSPELYKPHVETSGTRVTLAAFGVDWVSNSPLKESTQKYFDRFLKIDDILGLSDYLNQQLAYFHPEETVQEIITMRD